MSVYFIFYRGINNLVAKIVYLYNLLHLNDYFVQRLFTLYIINYYKRQATFVPIYIISLLNFYCGATLIDNSKLKTIREIGCTSTSYD